MGAAASSEETGMTIRQFEASLSKEDWLQRAILKRAVSGEQTTDKVRAAMKTSLKGKGVENPSKAVRAAVQALHDAHLVDISEKSAGENSGPESQPAKKARKGGWPVISFKKRPWAAIQEDAAALGKAEALRVGADLFDI